MSDRMNNIMSDLVEIIKIGVHIIYEELVKILRVVMRFLNDIDVSSPMGLHKKGMNEQVEVVKSIDRGELYEINFERNRYGYPRNVHFPKDINHPILKGEGGDNE